MESANGVDVRHSELRAEGGALAGIVVGYKDRARIGPGLFERFEPGSFGDVSKADVVLRPQHNPQRPIARTQGGGMVLIDGLDALHMRAEVGGTKDGDDTLSMVRRGILRGLSVEFIAVEQRLEDDTRVIGKATLDGLGVVDRPAYHGSAVEVRRAGDRGLYGRAPYGTKTTNDRGRNRKRRANRGTLSAQESGWAEYYKRKGHEAPMDERTTLSRTSAERVHEELARVFQIDRGAAIQLAQRLLAGDIAAVNEFLVGGQRSEIRQELTAAYDVQLTLGHSYTDAPLASFLAGSMRLHNADDGVHFVAVLPQSRAADDLLANMDTGAALYGVDMNLQIPPEDVVPGAVTIEPEP